MSKAGFYNDYRFEEANRKFRKKFDDRTLDTYIDESMDHFYRNTVGYVNQKHKIK